MPIVLAIAAWVLVTAFNNYTKRLDDNTQAIYSLANLVSERTASFGEELTDHDKRISRLEDKVDGGYRRSR